MLRPSERRKAPGRSRKHSPGRETIASVQALLWETIPLAAALALYWGFDWVAGQVAASAGPEWTQTTHGVLWVVHRLAFVQLIVPKGLVIINEIVALVMNIFETAADGLHRIKVAYHGEQADDDNQ